MKYPQEYLDYLVHFHGDRDFFECHEILEEYWKSKDKKEDQWVALIQIAVGLYHHRRGNYRGAHKMLKNAIDYFMEKNPSGLGIDNERLISLLLERVETIQKEEAYVDLNLPIQDISLLEDCRRICEGKGWRWQSKSSQEADLLHRHSRRDRTAVIKEREEQLQIRRKKRESKNE